MEEITKIENITKEVKQNSKILEEERVSVPIPQQAYMPTMWNDEKLLERAWKSANFLAKTDLVPTTYKNKPENCLIALDIANRTGLQPLTVMQNLYIVKGKPTWSGQMCIALINGCGRFTPLEYKFVGEYGTNSFGCQAYANRLDNGKMLVSEVVTIEMAKKEGWYDKDQSKWKTMPVQMAMYRAGAFFGRVYCPDVLLGMPLIDEVYDIEKEPKTSNNLTDLLDEEINKTEEGEENV